MKVIEFWVIYHPQLGKEELATHENYFLRMTGIGPAFGATFKTTPWFMSIREASEVVMQFPMMVLAEVQHVGFVAPEDHTFPTRRGLVQHYADLALEASFNRAAKEEVIREAQEKEDGERAEVRESEPGQGVQLDPRGPEPQEVEAEDRPSGATDGSDRPEVPGVEGVPGAEGGGDGGVKIQFHKLDPSGGLPTVPPEVQAKHQEGLAFWRDHMVFAHVGDPKPTKTTTIPAHTMGDSIAEIEDRKALAEMDKLIGQPEMGMGCFAAKLTPAKAIMSKGSFHDIAEPQTIEDVRFYVDNATRVDGSEHTQDPDSEWMYASGQVVCELCGKEYWEHPLDGPEGYDGKFLNRICDGRLVKL